MTLSVFVDAHKAVVGIIGAGPIGIEFAISLKLAGISYFQFDKGQAAQAIFDFPVGTRYFSSSERIGIAGVPIQTLDQQKCSREEYLAYIRSIVSQFQLKILTYENVQEIQKNPSGFLIKTSKGDYQVQFLVIATGGTSAPRKLNVPGEDQSFVHWQMADPHMYFQKDVLVIGGKNSLAETALRLYHAKANVTISTRKPSLTDKDIKYWILPELLGRIERKEITCYYDSEVAEILPGKTVLRVKDLLFDVKADFVIKAIGFDADLSLLTSLGVELQGEQKAPFHNLATMETNIPNVYVLGTVIGGTQKRFRIFIENSHIHVVKILKDLSTKLGIGIEPVVTRLKIIDQLEE